MFVKRSCPTCNLVLPVLRELAAAGAALTVYSQDDPTFPGELAEHVIDDTALETSYQFGIETVPTLLRLDGGEVSGRAIGWSKSAWRELTTLADLGEQLPELRPGCGSRTLEPGVAEEFAARFEGGRLHSRRIELGALEDEIEAAYERQWSDGLPVVPPTIPRVLRMLEGTNRNPNEIVAVVPPDLAECTVEKVAVNAVMAGCRPEYLPVVLAALEAACSEKFSLHGLLSSTYFSGPIIIVNGPIRHAIRMNSGMGALGPGNRANATIGRALQLVIRNVGGAKPGGVDRSTLGYPGKFTFCFAEDEEESPWESLAVERGFPQEVSTVTLFAGHGISAVVDRLSQTPESLVRSFAANLRKIGHPKLIVMFDAVIVAVPEHATVFAAAGWTKQRAIEGILAELEIPGAELVYGAGGNDEGLPELVDELDAHVDLGERRVAGARIGDLTLPKFRKGGLMLVHAGGRAGRHSAVIESWLSGPVGSQPVTKEVKQ